MTLIVRRTLGIVALVGVLASGCSRSTPTGPVAASSPDGAASGGTSGTPGSPGSPVTAGGTSSSQPATGAAQSSTSATDASSVSPNPDDPGTLPQTHTMPTADDPAFQSGVKLLWQAAVDDDAAEALPFFFPKSAYLQVKSLANASADYQNRLIGFYDLDIHAIHQLLGADAKDAQFVGISVPAAKAQWILPGVEYNKESYYRVYGSRITYTVNGKTKSFGVYSLISWRGRWYVVHLGPNPRPKNIGTVYAPQG